MESIWTQRSTSGSPDDGFDEDAVVLRYQALINKVGAVEFKYVAEGRANVVFAIWERRGGGDGEEKEDIVRGQFERTLLRVPKYTEGVTACDYESLHAFQRDVVEPRIGRQHLVPQLLIRISADVSARLNAEWGRAKKDEKHASQNSVIRDDGDGRAMLVQDMSASPGYRTLEFKPKWLAQSPLAPAGARRCRTCAREAFRNSELATTAMAVPICPLGLVHEDRAVVRRTVEKLAPGWTARDHARLLDAFEKTGIFRKLRDIQTTGDSGTALMDDPSNEGFGLAMTMRDCSCYVRMPLDGSGDKGEDKDEDGEGQGEGNIEIKLADTDKKNWEEKQLYWQKSHLNLVAGGWYTCTEDVDPLIVTDCLLNC